MWPFSLTEAVITEEDGWLYWRNSHYLDAKDQESLRRTPGQAMVMWLSSSGAERNAETLVDFVI